MLKKKSLNYGAILYSLQILTPQCEKNPRRTPELYYIKYIEYENKKKSIIYYGGHEHGSDSSLKCKLPLAEYKII